MLWLIYGVSYIQVKRPYQVRCFIYSSKVSLSGKSVSKLKIPLVQVQQTSHIVQVKMKYVLRGLLNGAFWLVNVQYSHNKSRKNACKQRMCMSIFLKDWQEHCCVLAKHNSGLGKIARDSCQKWRFLRVNIFLFNILMLTFYTSINSFSSVTFFY